MKTELQNDLTETAPSLCVETTWEPEAVIDYGIFMKGEPLEGQCRSDWRSWQATITVTTVVEGKLLVCRSVIGGNWERRHRHPSKYNPTISDHEAELTLEALQEMASWMKLPTADIDRAITYLKTQC